MVPTILVLVVLVLSAVLAAAFLAQRAKGAEGDSADATWWFDPQQRPLTKDEIKLFRCLQEIAGDDYFVAPQVHLGALLRIRNGVRGRNYLKHRNALNRRVDFVWCDRHLNTIGVIELDDRSHEVADQQRRDDELAGILGSANLPMLRIPAAAAYEQSKIASLLNSSFLVSSDTARFNATIRSGA